MNLRTIKCNFCTKEFKQNAVNQTHCCLRCRKADERRRAQERQGRAEAQVLASLDEVRPDVLATWHNPTEEQLRDADLAFSGNTFKDKFIVLSGALPTPPVHFEHSDLVSQYAGGWVLVKHQLTAEDVLLAMERQSRADIEFTE